MGDDCSNGDELISPRILEEGTREHTEVICFDLPGAGGACHKYAIVPSEIAISREDIPIRDEHGQYVAPHDRDHVTFGSISFQKGPIRETGINGCHNEDLIAIVIDRLDHFQRGPFACHQNNEALMHLKDALICLRNRTDERKARGVEGTNEL